MGIQINGNNDTISALDGSWTAEGATTFTGAAGFNGKVSIGGTLTYEDVTNIDSVGIVTAREGVFIPDSKKLQLGNAAGSADLQIYHDTNNSYIKDLGTGQLVIDGNAVILQYSAATKLETTSTGIDVTGTAGADALNVAGTSVVATLRSTNNNYVVQMQGNNASDKVYFGTTSGNDFLLASGSGVTERLRITSGGSFGFNTSTIRENIHTHQGDSNQNYLRFTNTGTGTGVSDGFNIGITASEEPILWNFENTSILFATNNLERLRIDSSGRFQIGSDPSNLGAAKFNIVTGGDDGISLGRLQGANVSSGDVLGTLAFQSAVGSQTTNSAEASIKAIAAENSSGSTAATNLSFYTKNTGTGPGSAPTERFKIWSTGTVGSFASTYLNYIDKNITGFAGGSSVQNYIVICAANQVNMRLSGTFHLARADGTSGVAITRIHALAMTRNANNSDSALGIAYNIESDTSESAYPGIVGKYVTLTYNSVSYFAIKLIPTTGADLWGSNAQHCNFVGVGNNVDFFALNSSSHSISNVSELTGREGTKTFFNSRIGINAHNPTDLLTIVHSANTDDGISIVNTNNSQASAIAQLELSGGDNAHARVQFECNGKYSTIRHDGNGHLSFYTNGSNERVRIDADGRFHIGSSNNTGSNTKLVVGFGNNINTTAIINTGDVDTDALTLSNWDGSTTTNKVMIAFDCSGIGGYNIGMPAASDSFVIEDDGGDVHFTVAKYGDVAVANQAPNSYDNPATSVNTVVQANENRSGVYWLNFNGRVFRAYIKANWLQDRNWVLAAKFFDFQDMPSGSSLWTNDTFINESDFNLYGGLFSKYPAWRYFSFNRLAMQMGNRIPPIMGFSSNQTLYGAFSGGRASNGGGVTANETWPSMSGTDVRYHTMNNYVGPDFYDVGGSEDRMQSYGLNKWANNSTNSTSAVNRGSEDAFAGHRIEPGGSQSGDHSLQSESLKGWGLTVEDHHPQINGVDSVGVAGAWIGCPLDEGNSVQGSGTSNAGADSGFGFGWCTGNPGRTGTAGYAEWGNGSQAINTLPAYIWLSID